MQYNGMDIDINGLIGTAISGGWQNVFGVYRHTVAEISPEEKAVFTDVYFIECLQYAAKEPPGSNIWLIAINWHSQRNLPATGYDMSQTESERVYQLLVMIRREFERTFQAVAVAAPVLDETAARGAINMWRDVFLSSQSVLNQHAFGEPQYVNLSEQATSKIGYYLRQSMYYPFAAERFQVNFEALLAVGIPSYIKVLLCMWLMNIPRYTATQYHRQRVIEYFPILVRYSQKNSAWMDPYFHTLVEWCMVTLFRLAYIHENNSQLACLFGDFVHHQMKRLLPQYCDPIPQAALQELSQRKIRIGYLSNRFSANAVTFYMANRLVRHDQETFEVHVFALGTRQDDMTEILRRYCDRFVRLENALDYSGIAQTVRDSKLDILVFADIGMEIQSFLLAGMRLAPVQAALLGHASPTGLPTVDYYFSSEVEPDNAQTHYRERLLRLPGPGADQVIPPGLKKFESARRTRKQLGIPDDAFVMVSCANGMKHVPERDYMWTEILRRIPNAWILLKPFSPGDRDILLQKRILNAGRAAGAPDRIKCLDGFSQHQDVFSLLNLADLQLDTYPFNGWTTTIEALCVALPTVTQEGESYRSRIGAAFLRSMGISEGIASDENSYIEWVERFSRDIFLCRRVRNRIKATRQPLFFENFSVQIAFENYLIGMVRRQEGEVT